MFGSLAEVLGLKQSERKRITVLVTSVIFILSFIRWERGADWLSYYNVFQVTLSWDFTDYYGANFEFGYFFLNVLAKSVFDNYTVLLFIYACILFYFHTAGILQLTKYPVTALLIAWSMGFAGMYFVRSGIAVAILFYSLKYVQQRRFFKFLFFLILGTLFHRSVFLFFIAYFIFPMNISPRVMILSIIGAVFCGFVVSRVFFSFVGELAGGVIEYKLNAYLGDEQGENYGAQLSYVSILINGIIKRVSLVLLGIFMLKKMDEIDPYFRGYVNLLWVGTIIYFSTVMLSLSLPRMAYPFDETQILLLPCIYHFAKNRGTKLLLWTLLFVFLTYRFCNNLYGTYYDLFVPYKSIFNMDLPVKVY